MANEFWKKILGTSSAIFGIGLGATRVNLKNVSGALHLKNKADSAFLGQRVANLELADGTSIRKISIVSPVIASDYTLTLPINDGSPSQVLQTDGSGVTSWVSLGGTADKITTDTTTIAFGSASPVAMFTLPANALVISVQVFVDTAFDGTAQLSVGITGTTSKYMSTNENDLTEIATFEVEPNVVPVGTTENLIITYTAGGATIGAGRVVVQYAVPS